MLVFSGGGREFQDRVFTWLVVIAYDVPCNPLRKYGQLPC